MFSQKRDENEQTQRDEVIPQTATDLTFLALGASFFFVLFVGKTFSLYVHKTQGNTPLKESYKHSRAT